MEIKGRPTIHPWLFYPGKTAGYLTWFFTFLIWLKVIPGKLYSAMITDLIALFFLFSGFIFIVISVIFLGKSIRIGLPSGNTTLRREGIYRISRNPMYIGVHLLTLACMIYTLHPFIILAGVLSFWVYHLVILGEEKFLTERFGDTYSEYQRKVRRYL